MRTQREFLQEAGRTLYPVDFTLGYLDKSHIKVFTDPDSPDVELSYTWVNENQIQLAEPFDTDKMYIRRIVPKDTLWVDFEDGARLHERNLDNANRQCLMATEEVLDGFFDDVYLQKLEELLADAKTAAQTATHAANRAEQAASIATQYPEEGQLAAALGDPDSSVLVGGVEAKRLAQTVIQISHLKALPTVNLIHGQKYSVSGFYANSNLGGGNFVYDANLAKSEHNGCTVFAPEAIASWSGESVAIQNLIDWDGDGGGCFVKEESSTITVDEAGGGVNYTNNQVAINNAIKYANVDGQGRSYVISGNVTIRQKRLSNVTLVADLEWSGTCNMLSVKDGGSYMNLTLNGRNSEKTALSGYVVTNGLDCTNASNCGGQNIAFFDIGNKIGTTVNSSYAIQIDRNLDADADVTNNHFSGVTVTDPLKRVAFHGRIRTDFAFIARGQQGYACYLNTIKNIKSIGCGFNNFEICGPDTYLNEITDVEVEESNSSDVFDFDHGAFLNAYRRCVVKSVDFEARQNINIYSNKETRVTPDRMLNKSYSNTFEDISLDCVDVLIPSGNKIRFMSNAYGDDISFIRPKIINVNKANIIGELNGFESLSFNNVPNSMSGIKIVFPEIDYCTRFLNLFGSSLAGGYVYTGLNILGGSVKCKTAVTTSTETAFYYNSFVDGLKIEIEGTDDSDALRFPRAWASRVVNSTIKGASTTGRLYNIGSTAGANNVFANNIVETVASYSGLVGTVSLSSSYHKDNVYVNAKPIGQNLPPVGTSAEVDDALSSLSSQHAGVYTFDNQKKVLKYWNGNHAENIPTMRAGTDGTLTFYAGVLTEAEAGFQVFNLNNQSLNIWNGTTFKRFNSVN